MQGKEDVIRSKIDIEIEEKINPSNNASQADIFNKLKARKDQITIRPFDRRNIMMIYVNNNWFFA